jgi:hypothetical protein|tara:strand:+ start:381 stop:869 length:489 start_codon:yes stop_codon:yes gene_type:complete
MIMDGNTTRYLVKTTISDLIGVDWNGLVIVRHFSSDISSEKSIVNILRKYKVDYSHNAVAVQVPEWSNGVDCKSIIRRFESCPALKLKGNKMNLRDIVHRLEEIEQLCDGETQPLVSMLIDEIIEHDMKMDKLFSKVNRDIEDDILHKLFAEGIKSGSVGEA